MTTQLDYIINQLIERKKNGTGDEPLDGDEVEDLMRLVEAKVNLREGNITQEEYESILSHN